MIVSNIFCTVVNKIVKDDIGREPPAITFKRIVFRDLGNVGKGAAIGREAGKFSVRNDQFLRQSALFTHQVKLGIGLPATLATGSKQQVISIRMPVHQPVGMRLVGYPCRYSTQYRHHIHILIAIVTGSISNGFSVRGKPWP